MSGQPNRSALRGLTLLEVLLALVLLSVVLAVALRLVRQDYVVEQALRTVDTRRLVEDATGDRLQQDLDNVAGQPGCIQAPTGVLLEIQTLARFHDAAARQSWLLPARVCYRVEAHAATHWLVREQIDLTAEQPGKERLVLLRDVAQATLRVREGREWKPATPTSFRELPSALEIGITRASGGAFTHVYLLADAGRAPQGGAHAQR